MKKKIVALALIAGLALAGAASADWGRGGYGQMGYGNCPQVGQGGMFQQLDQPTRDKIVQFFKDNSALRKEIVMKQAEQRALMQSEQPDPQAVAKVAGELYDLRTAMHEKAELAGVDQYLGPGMRMWGGMGMGGPGFGRGGHMKRANCWNQ
ncbi:MAG: periplasmic heavy metal sensor [Desulforhopalus sp.]